MKLRILIIDDDKELNELLSDYLAKYDFDVLIAHGPSAAYTLLKSKSVDLIVLDIMLPEKNGFEVCKDIRRETNIPIIILSARGDLSDRVVGLELGADDYMPKPFGPRELVARIHSILRRTQEYSREKSGGKILKSADLTLDLNKAAAYLSGEMLDLTTMEVELLSIFMKNPGITLSREQILSKVRGVEWDSFDRSIDVLISRLRHKLGDEVKNPKYLKTIWGSGYRFVSEVANADGRGL